MLMYVGTVRQHFFSIYASEVRTP